MAAVVLIGVGASLLVSPAQAGSGGPGFVLSLSTSAWALLFLCPLVVGATVYALARFRTSPPLRVSYRTGASASSTRAVDALGAAPDAGAAAIPDPPAQANEELDLAWAPDRLAGRRRAVTALLVVAVVLVSLGVVIEAAWNGNGPLTLGLFPSHSSGSGGQSGSHSSGSNGTGSGNVTGNGKGNGTGGNGTQIGGTNGTGHGGQNQTGNGSGNTTPPVCDGTSNCTVPPNGTVGSGHNNTTGAARGATRSGGTYAPPGWAIAVAAVGLSAVVGVLAMPGNLSRMIARGRRHRRPASAPVDPVAWGVVVREVRMAIEAGESPRDAIVRLYGVLIGWVAANAQDLDSATAREIQRTRLLALRVPPKSAEAITQIFEEARYSTHAVGPTTAARFLETLRAIETSLLGNRAPQ